MLAVFRLRIVKKALFAKLCQKVAPYTIDNYTIVQLYNCYCMQTYPVGVGASRTNRSHQEPRWAPGPRYARCPPPHTCSQNRRGIKTRGGSSEFGLNFLTKKVSSVSPAYDFSQGKNFRELFFCCIHRQYTISS